jgi:hypothetical protein
MLTSGELQLEPPWHDAVGPPQLFEQLTFMVPAGQGSSAPDEPSGEVASVST